jgi:hypothetical protein
MILPRRPIPAFPLVSTAFALLVLGFSAIPLAAQQREAIRVVKSDARELVVELTTGASLGKTAAGDLLPRVPLGSVLNAESPGSPVDIRMSVPVILPAPSGSTVEVVSAEYEPPVQGRIAPVPGVRMIDGIASPLYIRDDRAYQLSTPSAPTVELRYGGIARDVHAGTILVSAWRHDPAGSKLELLRRITLRVRFGGAPASAGSRVSLSPLTRSAFLNADAAAGWGIASRAPSSFLRPSSSTARAWMRVEVSDEGLYALGASDFQKAGIDLGSVQQVAIYGGDGGDLPERVGMADSNLMRQVPGIVERGDGGRIQKIYFYGVGPSRWRYRNGSDTLPQHQLSPYVRSNSYLVAVDGDPGRAPEIRNVTEAPTIYPTLGIGRVFYEEDRVNAIDYAGNGAGSGRVWFGPQFEVIDGRMSDTRVFELSLPALEHNGPISYRARVAHTGKGSGATSGDGFFTLREANEQLGSEIAIGQVAGGESGAVANAVTRTVYRSNASAVGADNRSLFGIQYRSEVPSRGFLDWYEVHYTRRLEAVDNRITFDAPLGSGVAEYRINGFASDDLIGFDVTDPANPVRLERIADVAGMFVFRDRLSPTRQTSRRYFITGVGSAREVIGAMRASFADLRNRRHDADILMVTSSDLRPIAEKYAAYRATQGKSVAVVTVDEIYSEFSHGNQDPTAIRDYVAFAMKNWNRKPSFLVMMGDASYDYRALIPGTKVFVPTFESGDDVDAYNDISSSAYDDYFVRVVGDDELIDLPSGRFPVGSAEEGELVLEKLKRYESDRYFGTWRETVVLSADDAYPNDAGTDFVGQSESLWLSTMPNWVEPRKIYLPFYPTEQITARRKPRATQDLEQFIDRGALITNWIGHGNPKVWAHEALLEKDQFIPRLNNDTALTFVTAATCNFGSFDAQQKSGAEVFLLQPNGGAVAVFSATRASFIYDNENLIRAYMTELFKRREGTGLYPSIGEALYLVKQRGSYQTNNQKYHIIGDPSMVLNIPTDSVEIVQINSVQVASDLAVVGALSQVKVEGVIRNPLGAIRSDFNGTAIVTLYDAEHTSSVVEDGYPQTMRSFGGRLFRGPATVVNGRFTGIFRIPKDIAYDSTNARLHVYAYNENSDAAGATLNVRVYGSDTSAITDRVGPTIKVFLDDRTFRAGDVVTPSPLLIVELGDTSGINSSGAGLGHRIEAWIDGDPTSIDLTDRYQTLPTSYQEGSTERRLDSLAAGRHEIRVRAWDIFNNPSETTTFFKVAERGEGTLEVVDVVNYPNPMARRTEFTFRHNQVRPLDVDIAIYTASGRRVRELAARGVSDRMVRLEWDGTDTDGALLANGVYLYRLRVRVSGEESVPAFEAIEKVAIVR